MYSNKAKNMLEKQGWKEGMPLGRSGEGITTAIKVPLKMNTSGLGYQFGKELTDDWWASAYNLAAKNVQVKRDGESLQVKLESTSTKKVTKQFFHDRFKRSSELPEVNEETPVIKDNSMKMIKGITCHKAARHGIRMTGKLERVERQEKQFLSPDSGISSTPSKKSKSDE